MKRTAMAVIGACVLLSGCAKKTERTVVRTEEEGHYYSEQEARQYLLDTGRYHDGEIADVVSEDGYFSCVLHCEPEENEFLTVAADVSLEARYDWGSTQWIIDTEENPEYIWHLDGSWYVDLESYEVYITFEGCEGNEVSLIAEAVFDKADGTGKETYGETEQTVSLQNKGIPLYDVYGVCSVSGVYPLFTMTVEKDRILLKCNFDGNEAEMVRI